MSNHHQANGTLGGRPRATQCDKGHDLTVPHARDKYGCVECRRERARKPLPPVCPKCSADLTDPANIATRTDKRSGRVARMCRPCKVIAARLGGEKRRDIMAALRAEHPRQASRYSGGEIALSGAEVEAILSRAERMETAPPWVRHPQAQTNVHYRLSQ